MRRLFVVAALVALGVTAGGTADRDATPLVWRQPSDPDALVRQGRSLMMAGKHDEAERLYRQALTISPRSFEAARALGILLNLKGQYPEARIHLQRAVDVAATPTVRHQAMSALALSYAFEGKLPDCQREYEAVRRQQQVEGDMSGAAASARSIGRILLEAGDITTGRKWYELGYQEWKPAANQPSSEQLLWDLRWHHMQARVAAKERRIDEARRQLGEFEAIMQRRGKLPEDNDIYHWVAGYVAYYAKDYERAVAELTQGDLDDPFILYMIGLSYEAKGDTSNAKEYYRRTMASNVYSLQSAIARPQARAKLSGTSQ